MNTDILILGGGLAGYCAAWEIIQNSAYKVDMLACGAGASAYIHGFCLPVGEGDSEALFARDTAQSGYHQGNPALIQRLCRDSLQLPAYFEELGLGVDGDEKGPCLIQSLGSSVPRIAGIGNNTGPVMLAALQKRLKASGRFTCHRHLRGLELLKKGNRVSGVRCYNRQTDCFETVSAGAVILATGGFGRLFPESTNSPDLGGDGCAMAHRAGCRLTDMEFIQFEPSAAVWPEPLVGKSIITTMFYEGAVLRNGNGDRFMDEQVGKDIQAKAIAAEIRKGNATPHGGVWFDATGVPQGMWDGIYKPYRDRYLPYGIDLCREPVEIAPAAHTTCGGVCIDENCRTHVEGLIACGEVTGGLHGANRLGGNAGLEVMVFGRTAGRTALEDYVLCPILPEEITSNREPDMDIPGLRKELGQILRRSMGVLRNDAELTEGFIRINAILETCKDYENCYEAHRLYNDTLTAKIALLAALHRRGSVGCHCREDSVPEDSYRLVITPRGEILRKKI